MGRASTITALPEEVRRWLERALCEQGFAGYEALEALMRDKGYTVSKSAIHRYGQKIERRMASIKASTEAAKMIVEAAGDDQDARSESVIALVQSDIFETIVSIQEADNDDLLPSERLDLMSKAAKNIATLTRASIAQKQFKAAVMVKAVEVAAKAERLASKGGLSEAGAAEIRNMILGIAA